MEVAATAPPPLVVVAGPTASGKTELALALARRLGGEVISADSRQVYRRLDAGTAKPARDGAGLAGGIPYHLLDCADPDERFDAARYAVLAGSAIEAVRSRGRLAIVAGGTGLYIRALLEGLAPMPPGDPETRRGLEAEAGRRGPRALHEELAGVDPEAARRIPAANLRRVIRALEVHRLTGRTFSSLCAAGRRRGDGAPRRAACLLIDWPPSELRRRIEERARGYWPGLLAEARRLSADFTGDEPGFQSLGYREALACVRGLLDEAEGLQRLIRATRAYAKRQRTWFRHQLPARPVAGGALDEMTERALEALRAA